MIDINAEYAFTKPDPNRSGQAYLEEFEAGGRSDFPLGKLKRDSARFILRARTQLAREGKLNQGEGSVRDLVLGHQGPES